MAAAAQVAARRFQGQTRVLEPLHSLADFCYAVRREVVDGIGAADEAYGLGPCWEMDYNVRAARAGFRGVWACAAYVHRLPFTPRRRLEESRLFEASRRLYQDKFCGLRLRGQAGAYEPHCRGDACEHFAPRDLIRIREPQSRVAVAVAEAPLVTCIMPTHDRRTFVPRAVRYFLCQDYPRAGAPGRGRRPRSRLRTALPADPRIRYLRLDAAVHRSQAQPGVRPSSGAYIVHWTIDDWYPPSRLRRQVEALREADVCGSSRIYYYDGSRDRAWMYTFRGRDRAWVSGNTLAYRRTCWERHPFADVQIGEDSRFLWGGAPKRVRDLDDPTLCVAMIHGANASPKLTAGCWWRDEPVDRIHALMGADLDPPDVAAAAFPLVSCIMPTGDRRAYLRLALRHFRAQDYPRKELIVVDDGRDPVGDLVEGEPDVRYVRLPQRAAIGRKRNLACQQARGELIAHWDDDDWYAPERLRYQVDPILRGTADLTGLANAFVLEAARGVVWTTSDDLHRRMFVGDVHGGTLVFRKAIWDAGVRYPEVDLAEDAGLLRRAISRGRRLLRLANPGVFVYVRHGRNAWRFEAGSFLDRQGWSLVHPPAALPPGLLDAYRVAAETDPPG